MPINNTSTVTTQSHPKYLWFLTLSYSMVIVLANWFDPRLIRLFGLDTDAGTLILVKSKNYNSTIALDNYS